MSVYFSNKQELLLEHLKRNLFGESTHFFQKRLLIVPNQEIDAWIRLQLSKELGICAGVETLFLDQAVSRLSSIQSPDELEVILQIEKEVWEEKELQLYLQGKEKRLAPLCTHLASLFRRYLFYGLQIKEAKEWQERLFNKLYPQQGPKQESSPQEILKVSLTIPEDTTIHLFAFSHLSPFHFAFFEKVAKKTPLFFYQLSPCQEFWSDMESDKEIGKKNLEKVEEFLEARHPLLATLGKVGRYFAAEVEERGLQCFEDYVVPEKKTALSEMQKSMLTLEKEEKMEDDSIQLHLFSTPQREVEGLFHFIAHALSEEKISPHEILIMAPDIALYEPFIHALFKGKIDYQIHDLSMQGQNPLMQGYLLLLDLEKKRWSAPALLELFTHPLFKQKMRWDEEDLAWIRKWIIEGNIRFGFDRFHVEQLVGSPLVQEGMTTWSEGLCRLLLRLGTGEIPLTAAPLLGEFADLVKRLYADLRPLQDGQKRSWAEWKEILQKLQITYFSEEEELFSFLEKAAKYSPDRQIPFSFLSPLLREDWEKAASTFHQNHLNALRFCSLLPMRGVPAQMICLLGMNHDAFPRKERLHEMDLLRKLGRKNPCPSRVDFDRYLFLEALLSVREKLYISTIGRSPHDGTPLPPSSLLSSLAPYISPKNVVSHPDLAFDKKYFDGKNPLLKNTSLQHFEWAHLLQKPKKNFPFIEDFPSPGILQDAKNERIIDIKVLCQLLHRPLKLYFEKKMSLYLRSKEEIKEEEGFVITPLELSNYRKEYSSSGKRETLQKLEKQGMFASESLNALAALRLENEMGVMERALRLEGTNSSNLITLQFSPKVKTPQEEDHNRWLIPSFHLEFQGAPIEIVGKIEGVSQWGLYLHEKMAFEKVLRHYPLFLLLNATDHLPSFINPTKIIFGRSQESKERFFQEPQTQLHALLEYYFFCKENPSPLFPEWVLPILEKDEGKLRKVMSQVEHDAEFDLTFYQKVFPEPGRVIEKWHPTAEKLFQGVKDAWF